MSEPLPNKPDSSGKLQDGSTTGGSGIGDGADGRDNDLSDSGDDDAVDMTVGEVVGGKDDNSVVKRQEVARDTTAGSPPPPDSKDDKR